MLSRSHSYPQYMDESAIARAVALWREGALVAFPTETVYGLGADATRSDAVARIYQAKDRPRFNPLIVHVASRAVAERYVVWTELAERLSVLWPGPLTLVMQARGGLSDLVSAGGDTVGVRVPAHPLALALLAAFDGPIAAPSANRSGRISPTCAAHVEEELGDRLPLILDGGDCAVGLESTVVDVSGAHPVILRPGAITAAQVAAHCGPLGENATASGVLRAPGQLASHYAPGKPVRLNATEAMPGEGVLGFGALLPEAEVRINLSEQGDLAEAATRLFAALRALDADPRVERIAAMPVPDTGIGEAINDRLRRAACDS